MKARCVSVHCPPPMALAVIALLLGAGCPAVQDGAVIEPEPAPEAQPEPCADDIVEEFEVDPQLKTDVLVVVDNSGSMCEEQDNLVANFYNPACPINVNNVQPEYQNPPDEMFADELADCGFIQILAAYGNDFRVGVITTDVGPCDNRFGLASSSGCDGDAFPDWGRRPQRGCLQAPPGADKKFIATGDSDIATSFRDTLNNVRTYGSSFERGLDAVEVFLTEDSARAPGCEDDRDNFVRDDARLAIIFLTDEDDCSHPGSDDFPDELLGESCDNDTETIPAIRTPPIEYSWCYTRREELTPVSHYADVLEGIKGPARSSAVRVAVIAGGLIGGDGQVYAAGCRVGPDGSPVGMCKDPWGTSNVTTVGRCSPQELGPDEVCCEADPGTRYQQLAGALDDNLTVTDSICQASLQDTMRDMASLAARFASVELDNAPDDPSILQVKIIRAGGAAAETPDRIPDGADPDGLSGWQYEAPQAIRFFGDALLAPGDEVSVFVGDPAEPNNCLGPEG